MSPRFGIVPRLKRKKIEESIAAGKRMDGRELVDYREIVVKSDVIEKAEGSAEVLLGDTRVMVGVKIKYGEPFEDTPDEGVLICNAEFVPIASPNFEPGPPGEDSIELARVVDRGLRSSEVFDFSKLAIIPGKQVYVINVDIYVLNYAGNLIDASAIAALAALRKTRKPIFKINDGEILLTDKKEPLKAEKMPVAITMVKIGESIILDPSADEEEVMDARLTVTVDEDGNICTIQKSGSNGLTLEEIGKAINIAVEKAPEIRSKITGND
jgi:exosome complex component RRP42